MTYWRPRGEFAARERATLGRVISEWARRGIPRGERLVNGFEILPAAGRLVTDEMVRRLADGIDGR